MMRPRDAWCWVAMLLLALFSDFAGSRRGAGGRTGGRGGGGGGGGGEGGQARRDRCSPSPGQAAAASWQRGELEARGR